MTSLLEQVFSYVPFNITVWFICLPVCQLLSATPRYPSNRNTNWIYFKCIHTFARQIPPYPAHCRTENQRGCMLKCRRNRDNLPSWSLWINCRRIFWQIQGQIPIIKTFSQQKLSNDFFFNASYQCKSYCTLVRTSLHFFTATVTANPTISWDLF